MEGEERARRASSVWIVGAVLIAVMWLMAPVASAATTRTVYVSNGFPTASNTVSALAINQSTGALTAVAAPIASGGTTTEGLSVTPDAKHVYVGLFGSNAVGGFNIGTGGALSTITNSPFAAGVNDLGVIPSPNGGTVFAWNHGSAIAVLTIAADGQLSQILNSPFAVPSPESNPFAGSIAPDGNHLYVPNENSTETVPGCGATCEVNRVSVYSVAANGALTNIQNPITGSTNVNPSGPNPFGSGITPDGKFLYVSNPEDGANGSISGFKVNANGTLTVLPGLQSLNVSPGNHPLNMAVSPDGQRLYVATRISKTVNAYTIGSDGSLTPVPGQPFSTGAADVNGKALALTPDGTRLYVSAGGTDDKVFGFNVAANGALASLGPGFPTGSNDPDLEALAITPNQPPAAAFNAQAAPQGQATSFDGAASADTDGGSIANYRWDFGDGTSQIGGPTTAHVYNQPGTYLASLTVTDDEGCSSQRIFTGKATLCNGSPIAGASRTIVVGASAPTTPPTTTPGRDTIPPRFQSGNVNPGSFAVDPRGAAEKLVSSVAKGTTLSYSLSEPARVVFTIDRKTIGRRVGRSCRRPTRANRNKRKCTLLIREGRFARLSGAGANLKRFSGRLGRKSLRLASYQLTFDAKDNAGNRARPLVRSFKIVSR